MLGFSSLRQTYRQFLISRPALKWTLSTLVWLPTGIVFTEVFYTLKSVSGRSMQPTLNPDTSTWRDIIVFDRFSIRARHQYQRGDVVALTSPSDAKLIVKRLVALEGDIVKTLPPYPDAEVTIPPGHAWVEGDEPFKSEDSNYFGPVPLALLDSKLSFIVWPLERWGPLPIPSLPDPRTKRSPAWRRDMADFERDQRRKARITISPSQHT